jgi:hypothetical protein
MTLGCVFSLKHGEYGFQKLRAKNIGWVENKYFNSPLEDKRNYLTYLSSEFATGFNMKVVAFSLIFPTHLPLLQFDIPSSSYGMRNEKVSVSH